MKQTLYLFVGYPGAGKTTIARMLAELTGAVHIWADQERHKLFGPGVTHSSEESQELYDTLNELTDRLLGEGKSVIFDTNFNFYKDREYLRQIARKHDAQTVLLWITTEEDLAKQRSVHEPTLRNGYSYALAESDFARMVSHLQPPSDDEQPIMIDGRHVTQDDLARKLGLTQ